MSQIPVAILGATGYAGELTTRILLQHDGFRLVHLGSDRLAGTLYGEAVSAFQGQTELVLQADSVDQLLASGAEAIVLAKKSPDVTKLVPELLAQGKRLVDIGAEFRLRELADYQTYYGGDHDCPEVLPDAVYGLSEVHADAIRSAKVVGNPGCYPTSILLPLIPLLRAGLVDVNRALVSVSYSGLSGAGKRFAEKNNNLFWAINENMHSYKALAHQHRAEVNQELSAAAGVEIALRFIPHLAPVTRGIHSTISVDLKPGVGQAHVDACWQEAYAGRPFVRLRDNAQAVQLSDVCGNNHCDFAGVVDGSALVVCSVIDNLIKGAAGQAVQNLNMMYGYEETAGLLGRQF